jgi:hypothetical protein
MVIIKPKQPFMDWLESTPGWDLNLSLEDIRDDCMALLIPEYGDNEKAMLYEGKSDAETKQSACP